MQGYLLSPVEFVLTTVFQLYIMLVMVRFLLQWLKADFYNPISQFLVKATNPPLLPLRRIIPGWGGIDVAAIVLMVLLQLLSLFLVLWLRDKGVALETLLLWSLAELIGLGFNVFLFAIIIQVIISWVNPGQYNPVTAILASLTEPLLRPARRLLPPISGIDLSPLLVLLALQVLKMLIVPPLMHLALAG
jgi:YggT family protein